MEKVSRNRRVSPINTLELSIRVSLSSLSNLMGGAALVLVWLLMSYTMANRTLLPSPIDVMRVLLESVGQGQIFYHIWSSLYRIVIGFGLALVVAFFLGLGMGLCRKIDEFIDPFVELFRPIPPYAWIPISILWFGVSDQGPVFITFIAAFFPIVLNVIGSVKSADPKLVDAARTLGASRIFVVNKVIVPDMLPRAMPGVRLGFGASWLSVLAAEMVGARSGLGFLITDARELLQTDVVIMGMVIIGLIGFFSNKCLLWLEDKLSCHRRRIS